MKVKINLLRQAPSKYYFFGLKQKILILAVLVFSLNAKAQADYAFQQSAYGSAGSQQKSDPKITLKIKNNGCAC